MDWARASSEFAHTSALHHPLEVGERKTRVVDPEVEDDPALAPGSRRDAPVPVVSSPNRRPSAFTGSRRA